MANRWFTSVDALQKAVVLLEGSCVINSGVSGKTESLKGSGIASIENVATGTYKVVFEDAFFRLLGVSAMFSSPSATAAKIDNSALSIGNVYVISTLGNATVAQWHVVGVPASVVPAVGVAFVAAATTAGTANTSTSRVMSPAKSGAVSIEVVGDANKTINNSASPHMFVQVLGSTAAGDTTLIPADPVDGSSLSFEFMLRNSSVLGKGE